MSNANKIGKVYIEMALTFAQRLDPNAGKFTVQTFSDKKSSDNQSNVFPELFYCEPKKSVSNLTTLNRNGHGIFVTINEVDHSQQHGKYRRKNEFVSRIRAVVADDDEKREAYRDDWPIKPSMIVESSPGRFHYYWFCDGILLEEFTLIQKSIANKYGTDPAVCDLARVMRLPGFYHLKNNPFLVKIVKDNDVRYSREEILSAFQIETEQYQNISKSKAQEQASNHNGFESGISKKGTPYIRDLTWEVHGEFYRKLVLGEEMPTSNAADAKLPGREDSDNDSACPYSLDENGYLVIHDYSKGVSHHFDAVSKARANAWKAKYVDKIVISKGNITKEQAHILTDNFIVAEWAKPELIICEKEDGRIVVYTASEFKTKFAPYQVLIPDADGKYKYLSVYDIWIRSSARREYSRVVFKPNMDHVLSEYNLFKGFAVKPIKGDWSAYRKFLKDVICAGDLSKYEYMLNWMANLFQSPGTIGGTAIVLYSEEQGTGKSFHAKTIENIIGEKYCPLISSSEALVGNFNALLVTAIFITASEAIFSGDRKTANIAKSYITDETIRVEPKGVDAYMADNILSLMITSNADTPVHLEWYDRRYPSFKVSPRRMQDRKYFGELRAQMDREGNAAMLYDLLSRDISNWDKEDIPHDTDRLDQKLSSMDHWMKWVYESCENGEFELSTRCDEPNVLLKIPCGFGMRVPTLALHRSYLYYCKRNNIRHIASQASLTRKLKSLIGFKACKSRHYFEDAFDGKKQAAAMDIAAVDEVMINFKL